MIVHVYMRYDTCRKLWSYRHCHFLLHCTGRALPANVKLTLNIIMTWFMGFMLSISTKSQRTSVTSPLVSLEHCWKQSQVYQQCRVYYYAGMLRDVLKKKKKMYVHSSSSFLHFLKIILRTNFSSFLQVSGMISTKRSLNPIGRLRNVTLHLDLNLLEQIFFSVSYTHLVDRVLCSKNWYTIVLL